MPIIEPISTQKGILEAVKQDPKLRFDPNLKKTYQGLGGTLTNAGIPFNSAVVSSATIDEDVLPDLKEEAKDFAQVGDFVDDEQVERDVTGQPKEEKDKDEIFTEEMADFNRKFGRQLNDATGIKKSASGGIDTTGAFDDEGNVIGGTRIPTAEEEEEDTFYKDQQSLIDQMKSTLDAVTKRQIDSIESLFNLRREQQREINLKAQAAIEQSLFLGGSARYAPISTAGIVRQRETAGLRAISELDVQEKSLINSALSAQAQGNFRLLEKELGLAKEKRAEKQAKTKELNDQIIANNKELRERAKEKREEFKFIQEQEKSAVESISSLVLSSLGEDDTENAKIISDFAEQYGIDKNVLLNSIIELDREIEEEKTKAAGKIKFIPNTAKQQGGIFNPVTGQFTPRKGGIGGTATGTSSGKITEADLAFTTNEEDLTITRVMRLLPTKLKDSEQERTDRKVEVLRGIKSGQTVQDIVDEIKGFVITNEKEKVLSMYLRTLSAGSDIDLSDLSAAINRNQMKKAMTIVENENLKDAEGELADTISVKTLIVNSNRVLSLLEKAPLDNLGAFDGRRFKVKKFFGLTDEETVATQQLETAIVNLLNEIRRKSLGTAVTESEVAFLEPLLTDLLDQPEIVKSKVNELKVGTLNQHNQARGQTTLPHISEDELLDTDLRLQTYREMAGESAKIKVRLENGQTGTIDEADFDSNTMEKI